MKIWRAHGMSEGVTGSDGGGGRLINVGALDMASFRLVRILQGRGVRLFYVTRDKVLCDNYPLKLLSKREMRSPVVRSAGFVGFSV